MSIKSQAFGGSGGSPFDDKQLDPSRIIGIKAIHISAGDVINSIQVTYRLVDGKILNGPKHGTQPGSVEHNINLEDNEVITGISGDISIVLDEVDQLTFYTARGGQGYRVFGPYGRGKIQKPFELVGSYHQIVAFFGRSGHHLNQIGVYYNQEV